MENNVNNDDIEQRRQKNIQRLNKLLEQRDDSGNPTSIRIDFHDVDLRGMEGLENANLEQANLRDANLSGCDLTGANLEQADLRGANLSGCSLTDVELMNADLRGANLSGSSLRHANLERANVERANLQSAILEDAILEDAILSHANLRNANLRFANLEGANLHHANLRDAILFRANLRNSILTSARLQETSLYGADLYNADLSHSHLFETIFTYANIEEVNFDGASNIENAIDLVIENINNQPQNPQQPGIAYEVHVKFAKFDLKKPEFLALINQPDKQIPDIYTYIKETFTKNITELFPDDDEKINLFNTAFNKINNRIPPITGELKDLIGKSIDFAFSQEADFKREYIKVFLDESCRAYSGSGDNLSCVQGIIERFVLSIGGAVQNLCVAGCENETYQKLDHLLNPKFDIVETAKEWWANVAETDEIKDMSKEERMENFKNYLRKNARESNSYNDYTEQNISRYANDIEYSFEKLVLGGSRRRKPKRTRKSIKIRKSKRSKKLKSSTRKKRKNKSST